MLRPIPGDPWGVEQHHCNTGAKANQQLNPGEPSNRQNLKVFTVSYRNHDALVTSIDMRMFASWAFKLKVKIVLRFIMLISSLQAIVSNLSKPVRFLSLWVYDTAFSGLFSMSFTEPSIVLYVHALGNDSVGNVLLLERFSIQLAFLNWIVTLFFEHI